MSGRVVDLAVVEDTMYVAYATGVDSGKASTTAPRSPPCSTPRAHSVRSTPIRLDAWWSVQVKSILPEAPTPATGCTSVTTTGPRGDMPDSKRATTLDAWSSTPTTPTAFGWRHSESCTLPIAAAPFTEPTTGDRDWQTVLTVPAQAKNEVVGFVDLVMDEQDPSHLIAASWDRTRRAHNFTEGGVGSGIWETLDGGTTWSRISGAGNFPEGPDAGRIGLAYHSLSGTLYALIDNQAPREKDEQLGEDKLKADLFLDMDTKAFAALDNDQLQAFLEGRRF